MFEKIKKNIKKIFLKKIKLIFTKKKYLKKLKISKK
jgi:hypothetical protein